MAKKSPTEEGWLFARRLLSSSTGASIGESYVDEVNKAIEETINSITQTKSAQADPVLAGFVAEKWHAGTFNIRAVASGSTNVAIAGEAGTDTDLGRNNYASVDVRIQTKEGKVINDYSSKYMANAKESAKEQARPSKDGDGTKYHDQNRLVPSDQVEDVREIASRRASNENTPENWREGYQEVADNTVDTVSDGDIESRELTKADAEKIAREVKNDEFDPDEYDLNAKEEIKADFIFKNAVQAGLSAAAISAIMKAAPEIYKAIDYLIKNHAIDYQALKKIGGDAIKGSGEGFLRGFLACTIQILCDSGKLGPNFIGISPTFVGVFTAIAIQTIKYSINVSKGTMTIREMGSALIDGVMMSAACVIGFRIGGLIGASLGLAFPAIGFLLGSLVGSGLCVAYKLAKNKFISFCVDSGFTCFGLVEQDYQLPEEYLKSIGIDITPIERIEINRNELSKTEFEQNINTTEYETIEIKVLRRGIIGINKVGYTF